MNARKLLWTLPVVGSAGLGLYIDQRETAAADKQDLKPAVNLPLTRVVLFNSGVGYFTRGGEVEGDARVDLTFHEEDVNDLLKSMVLEDFNGGRVAAVSYDSREPIARTLSSFAIDLNGSPTFANIVNQARGERVEVTVSPTATNQPGKLIGTVVGVEIQRVPAGQVLVEAEVLNMWCAEGMRAVKLADVQALRFSNPVFENEFRRALEVLALSHDAEKKVVSMHFAGDGKRKVQVGYVVEAPIWKTSYRLVLDGENKTKPYLQGWALVENPTDEDWTGVKMALVSGRPISFRMDLYNPLYVPRPVVEPEKFASLRPPTYDGGFARRQDNNDNINPGQPLFNPIGRNDNFNAPNMRNPQFNNGFGQQGGIAGNGVNFNQPGMNQYGNLAGQFGNQGGQFGLQGGQFNNFQALGNGSMGLQVQERYRSYNPNSNRGAIANNNADAQQAKQVGKELSERLDMGAIGNAATAGKLGDQFQYIIDHPVTLARQKSALLPIVGKDVELQRVSIYNASVQAKHPLLGLRLKNTTGLHLNQGPITVFEGSTYAGDTRVLDVQPNEERLIAYAIDLGTEVDPQTGAGSTRITKVKANKGLVTTTRKVREQKKYRIANRGQTDRIVIIEHLNRTNQQFKLVETDKPMEDTKDVYRFQVPVKAGEEKTFTVTEECDVLNTVALSNSTDEQVRFFLTLNEVTPELKAKLTESQNLKSIWDGHRRELTQVQADLTRLNADQDRIRKNLANTPKEAEVYQVYLKKLSDQEKEIDGLTAKQKQLMADEFAAKKKFEDYLANLTD